MEEVCLSTTNYKCLPPLHSSTSIRLIEMKPGEMDSDIVMSIDTCNLLDPPNYLALSYTWGDPLARSYVAERPSRTVWIDTKPFLITPNLYNALQQLRFSIISLEHGKTLLWIDAICINQDDTSERNHQVGFMGLIYSKALLVVSWVEKSDGDTLTAVKLVLRLRPLVKLWMSEQSRVKVVYNSDELYERAGVSMVKEKEWGALFSFYKRQYFSRAWIVQEIALAHTAILFCGHYFLHWADLMNLSEMMAARNWIPIIECLFPSVRTTRRLILGAPAAYMRVRHQFEKFSSSKGSLLHEATKDAGVMAFYHLLERLLYETWYFQATNDRDHVYAVLAIVRHVFGASHASTNILEPDYCLPVHKVFINVTHEIATKTDSTSIFSLIDHDSEKVPGLPSWVPDYSVARLRALAYSCPHRSYPTFRLARQSPEPTIVGDEFFLSAIRSNAIADLVPLGGPSALQEVVKFCLQLPKFYPNGQTRAEAFWRTQIADSDGGQSPAPRSMGDSFRQSLLLAIATGLYEVQKSFDGLLLETPDLISLYNFVYAHEDCSGSWLPRKEELDSLKVMFQTAHKNEQEIERFLDKLRQEAQPFDAVYNGMTGGRSLFKTSENLLGLAPRSAKPNDSVWFFPGSKVPFLLRSCGGNQYKLIGEAYLHGYMHGEVEAFNGPLQRISLV
jgi:hypothetical protein